MSKELIELDALTSHPGYMAAIAKLGKLGGSWKFDPRSWVPDEYERLERAGLVRCEFGFPDPANRSLRERTISLTESGLDLYARVQGTAVPSFVRYSFTGALRLAA